MCITLLLQLSNRSILYSVKWSFHCLYNLTIATASSNCFWKQTFQYFTYMYYKTSLQCTSMPEMGFFFLFFYQCQAQCLNSNQHSILPFCFICQIENKPQLKGQQVLGLFWQASNHEKTLNLQQPSWNDWLPSPNNSKHCITVCKYQLQKCDTFVTLPLDYSYYLRQ